MCFLSKVEKKNENSIKDENGIKALEEQLDHIEKNETWEMVPRLDHKNAIGTKQVFQNKLNEEGEVL